MLGDSPSAAAFAQRGIGLFGKDMIADSLASLRQAFRGRVKPEKWLRDNLHPMDLEDAREFIDDITNGGSSEKYFLSAIPYSAFLTIEADLFLLPDFLATIITDSSQVVTVLSHYQESGKSALGVLTEDERAAVVSFTESLMKTEEAAWMRDPLSEFIELIKKTPNQALQHNDPSCHESCLRTPRASRGRG